MEIVGDLFEVLFMLLSFALWLLPIAIAVWVLQKIAGLSRDVSHLTRQVAALAEHSGAPVVAPQAAPRRQRAPLWAFAAVLVVFLLVMGGLYVVPGLSSESGSSGSATVPLELPPAPAPVQDTPAR